MDLPQGMHISSSHQSSKVPFPLEFQWSNFDFCEDYDKIVSGLKHNLTLVRKTDDDAIFRAAAADAGKVSLDQISWFMRHVIPADAENFSIYRLLNQKLRYQ